MSLARLFGQPSVTLPLQSLVGRDRDSTLRVIEDRVRRGENPDPSHMAWMVYQITHIIGEGEARATSLHAQLDQCEAELSELRQRDSDNQAIIDYLLEREKPQ